MKIIIYKDLEGYCTTPEENYRAYIRNERRVQKWYHFSSPEEILEYSVKYFGGNKDDYIIIDRG